MNSIANDNVNFGNAQLQPTEQLTDTTAQNTKVIDPITMSTVGGWILSGAESAIKNGVKSFIKDALFGGGSSGPQYVLLHEQALQQIEDIVTGVVLNSDVENAKSTLMSFEDMLNYYNPSAQDNSPDYSVMPLLINYATSLKNHAAYRSSYNSKQSKVAIAAITQSWTILQVNLIATPLLYMVKEAQVNKLSV